MLEVGAAHLEAHEIRHFPADVKDTLRTLSRDRGFYVSRGPHQPQKRG